MCWVEYHPHGDASVYDALVRMAQDFSLRYPLVHGHGNFGSVDGDPPAAYRYTESKMSKISMRMLTDIDKETVDFMPNYDDRLQEPVVLPSRFPNLLVNGSTGIAVGMATNIPPHNLGEVIDGACCLLDNPNAGLDQLMEHIKGQETSLPAVSLWVVRVSVQLMQPDAERLSSVQRPTSNSIKMAASELSLPRFLIWSIKRD